MAKPKRESELPMLPSAKRDYPPCAWQSDGFQCRYPGSMTHSTLADKDTQWFCSGHFGCTGPVVGADIVAASRDYRHPTKQERLHVVIPLRIQGMTREEMHAEITRLTRQMTGKAPRGLDWAHRIMARLEAGEKVPMISEQRAREALGNRQPGEDE